MPLPPFKDVGPSSNISLIPPSQAFVDNRTTTLGPWVLGGFTDCILLGVVLCQVERFFRLRPSPSRGLHYWYMWLVVAVTALSVIKTSQAIAVVWIQNVGYFNDPDTARFLVSGAWWQVSVPLMTAITGVLVQSFFAFRFWLLTRRVLVTIPIVCAMLLGVTGAALSVVNIVKGNAKMKVMWLLVHLVSVFLADFMITVGTYFALKSSRDGFPKTISLVNRLMRLIFESALPPFIFATLDLILTQTLGPHLLWHLILNYPLSKLYVISLLYTLNSINEYRTRGSSAGGGNEPYTFKDTHASRRPDIEFATRSGIRVQTHTTTHRDIELMPKSPTSPNSSHKEMSFQNSYPNSPTYAY